MDMSEIHSSPLDPILTADGAGLLAAVRAGAHAAHESTLRVAQRWQSGVDDLKVARVMLALEYYHVRLFRNRLGRWFAPTGSPLAGGIWVSPVVAEMIRTGLLRHWRDRNGDHLIPAPVHYRSRTTSWPGIVQQHSACLFVGEDMGPMRSRLVDQLDLTDCLACESAVAHGNVPKL